MLCFPWTIYDHTEENTKYYNLHRPNMTWEKGKEEKKTNTHIYTYIQSNLRTDRFVDDVKKRMKETKIYDKRMLTKQKGI